MQAKEYFTADKSDWGEGPWSNEPDKLQWQDEATGLPCLIVRNPSGALCGYVGVTEGHPDFGKDYNDVAVETHGGLTFSAFCTESDNEAEHICHVPDSGEPAHVWWLGFDCAHCCDVAPALNARMRKSPLGEISYGANWQPTYKTLGYVKTEVAELATQLQARSR